MFKPFGKWFIVLALVFTVGGHWTFLQTVAWVGMTVNYSQDASLIDALAKTFEGKEPCKLCKFVKQGKTSEQKPAAALDLKKLDFFAENTDGFYFPILIQDPARFVELLLSRSSAPPIPPPILV